MRPQNASSAPAFYSPQLDGLRFLAALSVYIHHGPMVDWGPMRLVHTNGWLGVDLFLCISAFLLTTLLRLEYESTGTINIGHFLLRRGLRIWPLYLTFSSLMCLLAWLWWKMPGRLVAAWWLSHVSFTNNVMASLRGFSTIPCTGHLWTISLEEQIYFVLPFFLLSIFASKTLRRSGLQSALILIVILLLARSGLYLYDAPLSFICVLPLRADSFITGFIAALIVHDAGPWQRWLERPWLLLGGGLALLSSALFFPVINSQTTYQIFGYLLIALGCGLLLLASQSPAVARSPLASRPMRYLGKISYGLYVFHFIGLTIGTAVARRLGTENAALVLLLGFGFTLVLSALSYRILEKPFLRLKERFSRVASRPT